ncbi:hypothetical protein Hanom_Chr04g00280751 [Helianthus anomalus]
MNNAFEVSFLSVSTKSLFSPLFGSAISGPGAAAYVDPVSDTTSQSAPRGSVSFPSSLSAI